MTRLALLKLLVAFLAALGIFSPTNTWDLCNPGKTPATPAPTNCERVHIPTPLVVRKTSRPH